MWFILFFYIWILRFLRTAVWSKRFYTSSTEIWPRIKREWAKFWYIVQKSDNIIKIRGEFKKIMLNFIINVSSQNRPKYRFKVSWLFSLSLDSISEKHDIERKTSSKLVQFEENVLNSQLLCSLAWNFCLDIYSSIKCKIFTEIIFIFNSFLW